MTDPLALRWPAIFDSGSLSKELTRIVGLPEFAAKFYSGFRMDQPAVCQGDVLRLLSPAAVINENGEPSTTEEEFEHWLVIGNSCDNTRDLREAPWTPIVPIIDIGPRADVAPDLARPLCRYETSRRFYVPPWTEAVTAGFHVADLTRPVPLDRRAIGGAAQVVARMAQFPGWALLHLCLVRYLARDDGRDDPT